MFTPTPAATRSEPSTGRATAARENAMQAHEQRVVGGIQASMTSWEQILQPTVGARGSGS